MNASPAAFGVAEAALGLLDEDTSGPLRARLDEVRRRAYTLADRSAPDEYDEERLAVRIQAFEVMQEATTAAVVAGGGRALTLTSKAQRLAREGMFLLVQGQTAESRRAHLGVLAGNAR
jgi:hypothetical protein